jgi:hypothetical protein
LLTFNLFTWLRAGKKLAVAELAQDCGERQGKRYSIALPTYESSSIYEFTVSVGPIEEEVRSRVLLLQRECEFEHEIKPQVLGISSSLGSSSLGNVLEAGTFSTLSVFADISTVGLTFLGKAASSNVSWLFASFNVEHCFVTRERASTVAIHCCQQDCLARTLGG